MSTLYHICIHPRPGAYLRGSTCRPSGVAAAAVVCSLRSAPADCKSLCMRPWPLTMCPACSETSLQVHAWDEGVPGYGGTGSP